MGACQKCGDCCKAFVIVLKNPLTKDKKLYFRLRNFEIIDDNKIKISIYCKWLLSDGKCKNYRVRPDICRLGKCPK